MAQQLASLKIRQFEIPNAYLTKFSAKSAQNKEQTYSFADHQTSTTPFGVLHKVPVGFVIPVSLAEKLIEKITEELIRLENGPIKIFLTNDRINNKVFFIDINNNIRIKELNKKLLVGDYVKVIIESTLFEHGNANITSLGRIDNIASEAEIKEYFDSMYV